MPYRSRPWCHASPSFSSAAVHEIIVANQPPRPATIDQDTFALAPHAAFARGGPGAALGSALVTLIYIALVPDALLGVVMARAAWRVGGQVVVAFLLVSSTIFWSFGSPGVLSFFSLPVMALASIALAISQLLAPANAVASDKFREAGQWLAITYLFWVEVSLLNTEFLGVLVVPVTAFRAYAVFTRNPPDLPMAQLRKT